MQDKIPTLSIGPLPNDSYAFTNALYVSADLYQQIGGENPESLVYFEIKDFILPVRGDKKIPKNQLAIGSCQRQMMKISKIDQVNPKGKTSYIINL